MKLLGLTELEWKASFIEEMCARYIDKVWWGTKGEHLEGESLTEPQMSHWDRKARIKEFIFLWMTDQDWLKEWTKHTAYLGLKDGGDSTSEEVDPVAWSTSGSTLLYASWQLVTAVQYLLGSYKEKKKSREENS